MQDQLKIFLKSINKLFKYQNILLFILQNVNIQQNKEFIISLEIPQKQNQKVNQKTQELKEFDKKLENTREAEILFAERCLKAAIQYEKLLIQQPDISKFRLSPKDDTIYKKYKAMIPNLNVELIDVQKYKSQQFQLKLYNLVQSNKQYLQGWNDGCLVRIDASKPATQENSFIVSRFEWLCIELQRNRTGINQKFIDYQSWKQIEGERDQELIEAEKKLEQQAKERGIQ